MSTWVTIGLMLASMIVGGVFQLFLVGFYFGRKFEKYDLLTRETSLHGAQIEGLGRELRKLALAFAAHTGVAGGVKYESD